MRTYIIGSRQSELALTQTKWVVQALKAQAKAHGIACHFKIQTFVTKGDRILDVALSKVGGKGLFVKEMQQALLNQEIDMAVHSMKDVPSALPEGLVIGAMPERGDARDCLVSSDNLTLAQLPPGAKVGTSSLRRQSQILAKRKDLETAWIRGNVGTRLEKLRSGDFDAIVLAVAGLQRLGLERVISEILPEDITLPAVGQGALGIECRAADDELLQLLQLISDPATEAAVRAERSFLATLEGGCSTPLGAHGTVTKTDGGRLQVSLTGMVGSADGQHILRETLQGEDALSLGQTVAHRLLQRGADRILAAFNNDVNDKE